MTRQTFETLGHIDQFLDSSIILNQVFEIRILIQRFIERDMQFGGHHLRDLVHFRICHFHPAARVPNDSARRHRAERNDLRNVLAPVLFRDVVDHLSASVHAKVDIDVGQRHAFGIEETLKQQAVLQGIKIRDPHAIGHEAARGRTAARTDRDFVLTGIVNEIPDNEEVSRIFHALNDAHLFFEPLLISGDRILQHPAVRQCRQVSQALLKTVANNLRKIGIDRKARWNNELREWVFHLLQLEIAPLGDLDGLIQKNRDFTKNTIHLLAGLEIKLIRVKLHPIRIVDGFARLNAQKNVMRAAIIFVHVVAVVGSSRPDARALGNAQHVGNDLALLFEAVIMDFEKESAFAEDILIFGGALLGQFDAARQQVRSDFAVQACGEGNQAFAVFT